MWLRSDTILWTGIRINITTTPALELWTRNESKTLEVIFLIDRKLIKEGVYQTAQARPILRGGGPADYFEIGAEQLFRLERPID